MSTASNGGADREVVGTPTGFRSGRFVLLHIGFDETMDEPDCGYVTSWDTWEECGVVFESGRMPVGFRLVDDETGRIWHPGAAYEWEAAQT